MRKYKVVKLRDEHGERWAVVVPSIDETDVWDVVNTFAATSSGRDAARAYVLDVERRNNALLRER